MRRQDIRAQNKHWENSRKKKKGEDTKGNISERVKQSSQRKKKRKVINMICNTKDRPTAEVYLLITIGTEL